MNDEQHTDGTVEDWAQDALTPQQQKIAEWRTALDAAPNTEDMEQYRADLADAERMLTEATTAYRTAVAQRALVLGFQKIAAEEDTTAKMVHSWRRQYTPDAVDLSTVPTVELAREERRIAALEAKAEANAAAQKRIEEIVARHKATMEGVNDR